MLAIARKCVYVYTPGRVYVLAFDDPASIHITTYTVSTDKAVLHVNKNVFEAIIYSRGGN